MNTETQWESLSQERPEVSGYRLIYPFVVEKDTGKIARIGLHGQFVDDFLAKDIDNTTHVFPNGRSVWIYGSDNTQSWKVSSVDAYILLEQGLLRSAQVGEQWDIQWLPEPSQTYLESRSQQESKDS